jgi:mycobactin lysine-N-oxygenase
VALPPVSEITIAVIGSGPKALAIAAKATVLRENGCETPRIVIIERNSTGSAWTGTFGFTDGTHRLGTAPEKDVGFPYLFETKNSDLKKKQRAIDLGMSGFSWQAFLISKERYQSWIDKSRPAPEHREWAEYLAWVEKEISSRTDSVVFLQGEVSSITVTDENWLLKVEGAGGNETAANALVVTGTGDPKSSISIRDGARNRVFNGKDFWTRLLPKVSTERDKSFAIIGSGETAGSIAVALDERLPPSNTIFVLCKEGIVFSRGETFQENAIYSCPKLWLEWSMDFRKRFIQQTDRGVFSQQLKSHLDRCKRIDYMAGTVKFIKP